MSLLSVVPMPPLNYCSWPTTSNKFVQDGFDASRNGPDRHNSSQYDWKSCAVLSLLLFPPRATLVVAALTIWARSNSHELVMMRRSYEVPSETRGRCLRPYAAEV